MDALTLIMLAALAVLIFFTFRNGRKRSRDMAAMQERTVVGASIMTNFGLFGTIVAIDDEENQIQVETTPGTVITVHRQTIAKIITPDEVVTDEAAEDIENGDVDAGAPEYGQRAEGSPVDGTAPKKADD